MSKPTIRSWLAGLLDAEPTAVKPETRARLDFQSLDVRTLPSVCPCPAPMPAEYALAGAVYIDANDNGMREESEAGIAGQKVVLTGTTTAGMSVMRESVTDAHGNFYFGSLLAGHYTMTEVQPANFLDGKDRGPNGTPSTANDTFGNIVLAGTPGLISPYLFGELPNVPPPSPPPPPVCPPKNPPVCPPTDDKGSNGKGSNGKGSNGKGSMGKGSSSKGSKGKGSSSKGSKGKGSSSKASKGKGSSGKASSGKGSKGKGSSSKASKGKGSSSKGSSSKASKGKGSSAKASKGKGSSSKGSNGKGDDKCDDKKAYITALCGVVCK